MKWRTRRSRLWVWIWQVSVTQQRSIPFSVGVHCGGWHLKKTPLVASNGPFCLQSLVLREQESRKTNETEGAEKVWHLFIEKKPSHGSSWNWDTDLIGNIPFRKEVLTELLHPEFLKIFNESNLTWSWYALIFLFAYFFIYPSLGKQLPSLFGVYVLPAIKEPSAYHCSSPPFTPFTMNRHNVEGIPF